MDKIYQFCAYPIEYINGVDKNSNKINIPLSMMIDINALYDHSNHITFELYSDDSKDSVYVSIDDFNEMNHIFIPKWIYNHFELMIKQYQTEQEKYLEIHL